ncbi:MAG: c-type cytochrome [Chitinophagaceae bacterium]
MSKLILILAFPVITALKAKAQDPAFKAPLTADKVESPISFNALTLKNGKILFTQYCVACHGANGKGDGLAAASLHPRPANFLIPGIRNETNGSLFWKITTGKTPMPVWGAILTPTQRWELVAYIRSIQKNNPAKP